MICNIYGCTPAIQTANEKWFAKRMRTYERRNGHIAALPATFKSGARIGPDEMAQRVIDGLFDGPMRATPLATAIAANKNSVLDTLLRLERRGTVKRIRVAGGHNAWGLT